MALATRAYDSARYLETEEGVAAYLADAFEEGDPKGIAHALGVVARARGMTDLARRTGITRESLYRALNEGGNPEFATVVKVMDALGLRLTPTPARSRSSTPSRKKPRPGRRAA